MFRLCEHKQRLTQAWHEAVDEFADALSRWKRWDGSGSDAPQVVAEVEAALARLDRVYDSLQAHPTDHACGRAVGLAARDLVRSPAPVTRISWSDGRCQMRPWEQQPAEPRDPQQFAASRAFSDVSVSHHAPPASGVYGLSNSREWIYIGQTDNIRHSLFAHLAEAGTPLKARVPTGFAYELSDAYDRIGRQNRLVLQYEPLCNRRSFDAPERMAE